MSDLTLDSADPQDLADVVCGLTVIGAYSRSAGLDEDADRVNILRRRVVLENEDLSRALLDADIVTTGVDSNAVVEGIREILEDADE